MPACFWKYSTAPTDRASRYRSRMLAKLGEAISQNIHHMECLSYDGRVCGVDGVWREIPREVAIGQLCASSAVAHATMVHSSARATCTWRTSYAGRIPD